MVDEVVEGPPVPVTSPAPATAPSPPLETPPVAPITTEQVKTTVAAVDKAIETERTVERAFIEQVEQVKVPEVAAVLDDIAKQATANIARLNELKALAASEGTALSSEPVDLNKCFNKAMSIARGIYGAYERITIDVGPLKEQIAKEKSPSAKAMLEADLAALPKRAKDVVKAARQEIRDTPCLLVRDKVAKMRLLDQAVDAIDAGNTEVASDLLRGF